MIGNTFDRRRFVIGTASLSTLAMWSGGSRAEINVASGAFSGNSCARNTAEEVTAGIDLSGKTVLITGCGAGIGYETLRVLVLRGAQVYGLDRVFDKAKAACSAVMKPGVKGKAKPFACDHTDFSSVTSCADAVRKLGAPIDVLICNAGVYGIPQLELAEGIEKHFVINHLAHFILVNRLLDLAIAASQGRIVVVSSGATPYQSSVSNIAIDFANLSGQKGYDAGKMYRQSKVANQYFVRQLAKRLAATHATANALGPGTVKTEHALEHFRRSYNVDLEKTPEAKTVEQGAATTCYVATNPALDHVSGKYFSDCEAISMGNQKQDDELAQQLWTVSERLTHQYLSKSA